MVNQIRYSLALYCPDLTDSSKNFVPVGVLVVDEKNKRYAFKHLEDFSNIQDADALTKAIWQSIPEILEQNFEQYFENQKHELYKDMAGRYHGFISQVIEEMAQSTISFSNSYCFGRR